MCRAMFATDVPADTLQPARFADSDGVRVGAWFPHLMISGPGLSHEAMGLAAESTVDQFMVQATDGHHTELVVKLA